MLKEDSVRKDILIFNKQNQGWKEVGNFIKEVNLRENLIFIGGTTKIPDGSKFKIVITANTDPEEYNGYIETQIPYYSMSFDLLADFYNRNEDILPHYQLVRNDIKGCGAFLGNYERVFRCIENFKD